ncbi:MAG: CPBP family intramembrane metalloprotease [Planctomycetes bacterium]|nr:CPBP family intramembrane metalloprotease [Planctomycetota bacterium]
MQDLSKNPTRSGSWAAVVFALVLPTFVTLAYFVWAESFSAGVQQSTYAIAKVVQFGFPVFWVCWICRQRLRLWPTSSEGIGVGIVFGLVVAVAMFALYHGWLKSSDLYANAEGVIRQKITGMELDRPWKFIALGVFYSLFHSLLEEYYWRWFVFGQLRGLVRFWPAVAISSFGFMAHHVIVVGAYFGMASLETWLISFSIALGGAFWSWLYHRSGSLVGPWLSHLLVDSAIFVIGYDIVRDLIGG